ncbi:kynureninase [Exophiala spinifera]|uniref:Kynureninase n=1 Tax=Exophiala spinifera TaxID=91928 RepID=A0A0D1YCU9_9EURO|nr:kynureninase [Exophiala spinifera]KIW12781.1 kynureninase [Exophiala spinifera]
MAPEIITNGTDEQCSRSPAGKSIADFPSNANNIEYARSLDACCPLRHFRNEFIIPSKSNLRAQSLSEISASPMTDSASDAGIYFCGNSLGLQPKRTSAYVQNLLSTWATICVDGHFRPVADSPLAPWQDLAESASKLCAPLVGAVPSEVSIQNTLSVNLHLMMASFYRPTAVRNKVLLEFHAFPSDHYTIESQIKWHGYDPDEAMLLVTPDHGKYTLSTSELLATIDAYADQLALIVLPGIQYYTGQMLDIPLITEHAHKHGIPIGWDLAHAAGNVPLQLHDWGVDFAVWCTYKYLNSGPGSIGGLFVHERHGKVEYADSKSETGHDTESANRPIYRERLTGWYGGDRAVRFNMDNKFIPIPGAAGYQISNPSAIDLSCVIASLSIFNETSMQALREKSLRLTAYAEHLLLQDVPLIDGETAYKIITPCNPNERGAQLSLLFKPGLLDKVGQGLKSGGVVADQRKPAVCRIPPAPLYNTYEEVYTVVRIIKEAVS